MLLTSPLATASNNIVRMNRRSENNLLKAKNDYERTISFINLKVTQKPRGDFPDKYDIAKITNFNILSNLGGIGGILRNFISNKMDISSMIERVFPGKGAKVGSTVKNNRTIAKPKVEGGSLKLNGIRALGITNVLFSGLDIADGIQQGESIAKATSGAVGSLAGSFLGGAIGQALIPVPGLGFMIGSAVGGFLGGWSADRIVDTVSSVKQKQEEKLKEQKISQDNTQDTGSTEGLDSLVKQFETPINKFDSFVKDILEGKISLNFGAAASASTAQEQGQEQAGQDVGSYKDLLDYIAKYESESHGGYEAFNLRGSNNGYTAHGSADSREKPIGGVVKPLTQRTVAEVMQLQAQGKLHASGRYQIVGETLKSLMSGGYGETGVKTTDLYNAETQDKLGVALIKARLKSGANVPNFISEWRGLAFADRNKLQQLINQSNEAFKSNSSVIGRQGQTNVVGTAKKGDMVSGFPVTSGYGNRNHPVLGGVRMHGGVDISAPEGTYVSLSVPVEIIFSGNAGGYGLVVDAWAQSLGVQFRLAHLSSINVRRGQMVSAGGVLGRVGSTGTSTGPHLHFEASREKNSSNYGNQDPSPYLKYLILSSTLASPSPTQSRNIPQSSSNIRASAQTSTSNQIAMISTPSQIIDARRISSNTSANNVPHQELQMNLNAISKRDIDHMAMNMMLASKLA